MIVKFRIKHRPDTAEKVKTFHAHLMDALIGIDALRPDAQPSRDVQLQFDGDHAAVDLTPVLRDGFKGAAQYGSRNPDYIEDKAMYDDRLILELDTDLVDYGSFVEKAFASLISRMKAYRAEVVLHKELDLDDHDAVIELCEKSGRDENGRDGVFRLSTVNYFDRELCRRAFGLSPEEVVKRVSGKVTSSRVLGDGALIIYTLELIGRDEFARVDSKLRAALK